MNTTKSHNRISKTTTSPKAPAPSGSNKRPTARDVEQDIVELKGQLDAISKTQAIIEFELDGTIVKANDNFLNVLGYTLEEIQGQHHSMFVDPDFRQSAEYRDFWDQLAAGKYQSAEYKRIGKGGKEVWIQGSYNPILDLDGQPFKVVKFAIDVTESKLQRADFEGQIDAISKAQATIEFDLDGNVQTANDNFLKTLGYQLDEIKGRHHSMFVDPVYRESFEYKQFWTNLREGKFQAAEYKRIGKEGKEVWIQASYNPIFDMNGKPFKVVKFAVDVTDTKLRNADFQGQINAIDKAQAVIEFDLNGNVQTANKNFLDTLGYHLDEIKGEHHSMFVEPEYRQSIEYRQFWEDLRAGKYQAGDYKRIGKGGKEVWIQGSYNPIFDLNGTPFKVVKYATDITAQKEAEASLQETLAIITRNAQALTSSSVQLSATAQQMSANSEETSRQSETASAAAEQVSKNVEMVATAAEEMSSTVQEVAKSANEAASIATTAVNVAESTDRNVAKLGESSKEIGQVIKVITSIAQQTNLLALNATIEAARAGEAGKGFAVVANEVKELAKQTATATEDISQKIGAIQEDTSGAIVGIAKISEIINQINAIQQNIASAVEEQAATTNDIAKNANEAANGSVEITRNIASVSEAAQSTAQGATETLTSAQQLATLASELQAIVDNSQ